MTAKEKYAEYLQTDYWKQVSAAVKARAGHRCQICNSSKELTAHHRTYANKGNEMEHLGDLVCLCWPCHSLFHAESKLCKNTREPRKKKTSPAPSPVPLGVVALSVPDIDALAMIDGKWDGAIINALGIRRKKGWIKKLLANGVSQFAYDRAKKTRKSRLKFHEKKKAKAVQPAGFSYLNDHLDKP